MSRGRPLRGGFGQNSKMAEREKPRDEIVQLCGFRIGDEEYALDIMRIKEIINPLQITRVPRAAAFIEGVVELRGTILPIVDMRKRFELPPLSAEQLDDYAVRRDRQSSIRQVFDRAYRRSTGRHDRRPCIRRAARIA